MKRIYFLLIAISFIFCDLSAQHISCNELEQIKQEIMNEINDINRVISPRLHPRDRQFLESRLNEISKKLEYLTDQSYSVYAFSPMPEVEFNLVMRMIEHESFDNDKVRIIESAMMGNYFMINQLTRLLEKISFEDNRLKVIEIVYPNILDRENSDILYDYLSFTASKDKLNHIIMEYRHPIKPQPIEPHPIQHYRSE